MKEKIVEEAAKQRRSVSDLGKIYLSWLQQESEAAGSWEDLQRLVSSAKEAGSWHDLKQLVSAAKLLQPMAEAEERSLADMLGVSARWLAEEHKRAGSWRGLKARSKRGQKVQATAPDDEA